MSGPGVVMFGELGVLADDGDRVQCHICGKMYLALNQHVMKKHNISCDEYRERFGLNKTCSLASPTFQETQRAGQSERLKQYPQDGRFVKGKGPKTYQTTAQGRKNRTVMNQRTEKLEKQAEQMKDGIHPVMSESARAKATATRQTETYREKARQHAHKVLFTPETREKALAACGTPEARAKRTGRPRKAEVAP